MFGYFDPNTQGVASVFSFSKVKIFDKKWIFKITERFDIQFFFLYSSIS